IVLSIEDKLNYLEQPIPPIPVAPAGQQVDPEILAAHTAWQSEQELLQTTRDFHSCRKEEGQSVSSYVLKMKGYIDNLERLGHPVTLGLGVSLILIGLRKKYDGFVQNYNMHSMAKTVNELRAMLKLHEQTLPKSNAAALNAIRAGKVQKGNKHKKSHSQKGAKGQNQGKGKFAPKPKISPPPKRENPAKDSICHEYGEIGHWKRTCPQYLAELMKKKKNTASGAGGSGIFVIELNAILNRSLIYDTGYGTRICNTTQGLRASRKLKPGALILYVGNGQREAVEAIGAFYLCLSSGLEIVLNNCYYSPSITRGVISVSRLYEDGFVNRFIDNTIQVSRNNVVYFCAIPRDGIFEIDLSNSLTNESSVYAHNGVSERRNRTLLDMVRSMMSQTNLPKSFYNYALETAARILNMVPTKIEKTPYEDTQRKRWDILSTTHPRTKLVAQNAEFLENSLIDQEANRMCLYIDAEEHELGDLREPANYKAALFDPESEKWLNAMNVEMQSMKDNEVWVLVELPPNGKTVGIADIRAIRILIAIAAYYDYEIWQMDVKTAFLNGYLNEKRYCMENSKRGSIHMHEKLKLSKSQGASTPAEMKRMQNVPYASANPGDIHWTTVKNILKYLRNTKDMFLVYEGDLKRELRSAKQSIFATSSAEAEYIAAFDAFKEAVWVRKFISRLGVVPTIEEPISMYCDNTGAIAIANESGITKGARHFCAKVHYLREVIEFSDIKLEKVHTCDNLADPFTKALGFPKHSEHTKNIGMLPASSLM
nr:hypothetical protein [Tanacetum cinerariifolium]